MRKFVGLAALLLAGCATGVPVERQVVVSGGGFSAVQGEAALLVRSFVEGPEGTPQEVTGAACDVISSLYKAQLVTPSRLVVPNFGAQSPELSVSCRAGRLSGSGQTHVVTRWQQPPGAFWGPPGAPFWRNDPFLWGDGWGGPAYPVSDYPNLNVLLR